MEYKMGEKEVIEWGREISWGWSPGEMQGEAGCRVLFGG